MNLRKEFYVKGKEWRLEYRWSLKAPDGERVRGLCDFDSRTIYLDRLVLKEEKWSVFLHELVHAILYEAHLHDGTGLELNTEEIICEAMTDALENLFTMRWKRQ